ncbi:Uncharacterized protein GBIM_13175 [Gryllus bimaculatus]|nr:Uncharacterized protein GBIM_13175 [Gryllus bimaculatus]
MGKIRRQRKKYHLSKNPDGPPPRLHLEKNKSSENEYITPSFAPLPESFDNIFKGIDISKIPTARLDPRDGVRSSSETNNLAASLALLPQSYVFDDIYSKFPTNKFDSRNDDARTTISVSKSVFKNRGASKEERRKLRHQTFIERINAIQAMKMKKQNKKTNKKILVKEEPSTSGTNTTIAVPQENKTMVMNQGRIVKSRVRHARMLKDIAVLTKLWENPEYKADPSGFVSDTVHERLAKEIE